jgi:hypothetical protein
MTTASGVTRSGIRKDPTQVLAKLKEIDKYLIDEEKTLERKEWTVLMGQIYDKFDLAVDTWPEWQKLYCQPGARFNKDIAKCVKKIHSRMESRLAMGALKGSYNVAAAIFTLKNKHNWSDKQELAVSGAGSNVVNVISYDKKDVKDRLSSRTKQAKPGLLPT